MTKKCKLPAYTYPRSDVDIKNQDDQFKLITDKQRVWDIIKTFSQEDRKIANQLWDSDLDQPTTLEILRQRPHVQRAVRKKNINNKFLLQLREWNFYYTSNQECVARRYHNRARFYVESTFFYGGIARASLLEIGSGPELLRCYTAPLSHVELYSLDVKQ